MKVTERDVKLVRDASLSRVLSRSQTIELDYFGSISRANSRLRVLCEEAYLKVLSTPFFGQYLYGPGPRAKEIVGDRIANLLSVRTPSPQLVQHSLAVTSLRVTLCRAGATNWRFEPQVTQAFIWKGNRYEVRPDGFVLEGGTPTFLECDMGHVSLSKFESKLTAFRAFNLSGALGTVHGSDEYRILTVTTSDVRKARIKDLAKRLEVPMVAKTFEEFGINLPGGWS